jgi:hypothetical protein
MPLAGFAKFALPTFQHIQSECTVPLRLPTSCSAGGSPARRAFRVQSAPDGAEAAPNAWVLIDAAIGGAQPRYDSSPDCGRILSPGPPSTNANRLLDRTLQRACSTSQPTPDTPASTSADTYQAAFSALLEREMRAGIAQLREVLSAGDDARASTWTECTGTLGPVSAPGLPQELKLKVVRGGEVR